MCDFSFAHQLHYRLGDKQKNNRWQNKRYTIFSTLEDLDFTDDLALVSHTLQKITSQLLCSFLSKTQTNSSYIRAAFYPPSCMAQNDGEWQQVKYVNDQSLRRISRIFWPNTVANEDLFKRCQQDSMDSILTKQRWNWIGHVLSRAQDSIPRVALHWTPEGRRKRGWPKTTWCRTEEEEIKSMNLTSGDVQKKAQNLPEWRPVVAALHARRNNGQWRKIGGNDQPACHSF